MKTLDLDVVKKLLEVLHDMDVIQGFDIQRNNDQEVTINLSPKIAMDKVDFKLTIKDLCNAKTYNAINGIICHINETVQTTNLTKSQCIMVFENIGESLLVIANNEKEKMKHEVESSKG